MWLSKNTDVIIFLLKPITTYTTFAMFRKLTLPMIGLAGTVYTEQLLWQNAGFFSIDLNFQYLMLVVYWALLLNS